MFHEKSINDDLIDHRVTGNYGYGRPKDLAGIEDNNGWNIINSNADLPDQTQPCHVEYKAAILLCVYHHGFGNRFTCVSGNQVIFDVDAWRPIVSPPKRIY